MLEEGLLWIIKTLTPAVSFIFTDRVKRTRGKGSCLILFVFWFVYGP